MLRWLSILTVFALPWLCQCQSNAPNFVRNPNQWPTAQDTGEVAVLTHAPATYREIGPVSAKRPLGRNWKRALATMKEQAAAMGANAIVVPQLATYDRAALTEAYLGEEGAFTPGPSSRQLKMKSRVHGLAIQLP